MEATGSIQKQKIDTVKGLTKDKLFNLVMGLVEKLGYIDISHDDNVITGIYSGPLSKHKHAFIYLDEKLISSEEIEGYKNKITDFSDSNKIVTFFVFSNNTISKGFQVGLKSLLTNFTIDFLGRDDLIPLIDKNLPDFWKHDDVQLLKYENAYCESIYGDNDLKKLQIFNEKYDRLLKIFIEPNYYHFYEDKNTNTPIRKKVGMDQLCGNKRPLILSGSAGTGKTTSLKKIGEQLISKNKSNTGKRNLPIFLSLTELFETNYDVQQLIENKLRPFFDSNIDYYADYNLTVLVDTIDELEDTNQNKILSQLEQLYKNKSINFVIASRNQEKLYSNPILKEVDNFSIEKFNNDQIKRFISNFFLNEQSRADALLDALRDNRILEKMPITPLTLSLISILYEENNLEIPATITDIYDNFNAVLLGKAIVSTRLEFIDSSFRERILSLYGFALLRRKEHAPMSREEFFTYFTKYFDNKTLPIRKGTIEDVLEYLIRNTGILVVKDGKFIQFSHDSFMEYYGAIEIFKHQRDQEYLMTENFFDINWQNASFFYGGKSRDMAKFLTDVIEKVKGASKLNDFFMGVIGLGYLMQSLYQTDNKLRKEGVDVAVNINIQAHEALMKISSDEDAMFKNYKLPILLLMNVFYFYENFNSITLKDPLTLSFKDFYEEYKRLNQTNYGYRSLKLALTLNSKRINESSYLEELIFNSNLTNDASLAMLATLALDMNKSENYKELKKAVKKDYNKLSAPLKKLTDIPAGKLRFSNYDTIRSERKVILITEGKTDARILEHAFMVLTEGNLPYWEIKAAGDESGGAKELGKTLQNGHTLLSQDQILIGIFDRDSGGIEEFKRLRNFEETENHTLRKYKGYNVYALCLPAIASREHYIQEKQVFNFLEIEHYFTDDLLKQHNKLKETAIKDVYEITGNKNAFANEVIKIHDPAIFENFVELFQRIDKITGIPVTYV
ncbi:NACHT domain-containing protein [Parapedobacter defluvii]|nr:NACHT domain-containing protein [Parapedobacter defluvii]HLT87514.1 NACHT domain-containing protein [Sphingobacterium sp.]